VTRIDHFSVAPPSRISSFGDQGDQLNTSRRRQSPSTSPIRFTNLEAVWIPLDTGLPCPFKCREAVWNPLDTDSVTSQVDRLLKTRLFGSPLWYSDAKAPQRLLSSLLQYFPRLNLFLRVCKVLSNRSTISSDEKWC
jgi:hypothetical protein